MSNLCTGAVTFYSENEESVKRLMLKLEEIYNSPKRKDSVYEKGWLGHFANTFFPEIGWRRIPCQGRIELGKMEKKEKYFVYTIYTSTRNEAKIGIWHHIVEKFYPDIKIAYVAEECSMGYYVKWDETGLFYQDEYCISGCVPVKRDKPIYLGEEDHYWTDLADLQAWLDELLPFKFLHSTDITEMENSIQEILDELDDDDGEDKYYFNIYPFISIPPAEFEFEKAE